MFRPPPAEDPRPEVEALLREAPGDPGHAERVGETLRELRRELAARPLDARLRIAYSGLLLGTGRSVADTEAAAFHASAAARMAPATLSVVRPAIEILARGGRRDEAIEWNRHLFTFAPDRGARTLSRIEPLLPDVEAALPASPEAWLAWHTVLLERGAGPEETAWLSRAYERWPDHLPLLERMAVRASLRRDWDALAALFPDGRSLPAEPGAARPLLHRARLLLARDDRAGASRDLERALSLDDSISTRTLAGEVCEELGEHERARHLWRHALFSEAGREPGFRKRLLVRLARSEERTGSPAAARRYWGEILELDPGHAEASRRLDELTGYRR